MSHIKVIKYVNRLSQEKNIKWKTNIFLNLGIISKERNFRFWRVSEMSFKEKQQQRDKDGFLFAGKFHSLDRGTVASGTKLLCIHIIECHMVF